MILKILGWIWLISGIFYMWKPEWLRSRLQKKSVKKLKWLFFGVALSFGVILLKSTWGMPGLLALIVKICGLIAVLKAFILINGKTTDHLIDWFTKQPVILLRVWAGVSIALASVILFL